MLNDQGIEQYAAILILAHEAAAKLAYGQDNGFLLSTRLKSLLPTLIQKHLH